MASRLTPLQGRLGLKGRQRKKTLQEQQLRRDKNIELKRDKGIGKASGDGKLNNIDNSNKNKQPLSNAEFLQNRKENIALNEQKKTSEQGALKFQAQKELASPQQKNIANEAQTLFDELTAKQQGLSPEQQLKPQEITQLVADKLGVTQDQLTSTDLNLKGGLLVPPVLATKFINGSLTKDELISDAKKRLAIGGAALASVPLSAAATFVTSSSVATISKAVLEVGLGIGGLFYGSGLVTDYKGKELETHRKIVKDIVSTSSTQLSIASNGGDAGLILSQLKQLSNDLDLAEANIKQIGATNIQFRVSKEYIEDQISIRDARANIAERVRGVQTIAITGRTTAEPGQIISAINQLP